MQADVKEEPVVARQRPGKRAPAGMTASELGAFRARAEPTLFRRPPSERQAMAILYTLFGWLTEAGDLAGNAVTLASCRHAPTKAHYSLPDPQHVGVGPADAVGRSDADLDRA